METKCAQSKTYNYRLDDERLNWLTKQTNRSNGQTQFLFQLVDGDFEKLKKLEMNLYNCFCGYCPGDVEEVNKVLNLTPKKEFLKL